MGDRRAQLSPAPMTTQEILFRGCPSDSHALARSRAALHPRGSLARSLAMRGERPSDSPSFRRAASANLAIALTGSARAPPRLPTVAAAAFNAAKVGDSRHKSRAAPDGKAR
jgi:hypothetical protein